MHHLLNHHQTMRVRLRILTIRFFAAAICEIPFYVLKIY